MPFCIHSMPFHTCSAPTPHPFQTLQCPVHVLMCPSKPLLCHINTILYPSMYILSLCMAPYAPLYACSFCVILHPLSILLCPVCDYSVSLSQPSVPIPPTPYVSISGIYVSINDPSKPIPHPFHAHFVPFHSLLCSIFDQSTSLISILIDCVSLHRLLALWYIIYIKS